MVRRFAPFTLAAAAALLATPAHSPAQGAAPGGTLILAQQAGKYRLELTVDPKAPTPGRRATLVLRLTQKASSPHPLYGDQEPVKGAALIATLSRPGKKGPEVVRYAAHPLSGAGMYGAHWTPPAEGVYDLVFSRRGEPLAEHRFQIGVGVEVPGQAEGSDTGRARLRGGVRGPLVPVSAGPTLSKTMESMAEPAALLSEALAAARPDAAEIQASLDLLRAAAASVPGTVPSRYKVAESDYETLAGTLGVELAALDAQVKEGKLKEARKSWRQTLDNTCSKCHVKFWWAVTPELTAWPQVSHKEWRR